MKVCKRAVVCVDVQDIKARVSPLLMLCILIKEESLTKNTTLAAV
jgi:hypothetical protein